MDKLIFNIKIVKLLQFNENIDLIIPKAFEDPFTSKNMLRVSLLRQDIVL